MFSQRSQKSNPVKRERKGSILSYIAVSTDSLKRIRGDPQKQLQLRCVTVHEETMLSKCVDGIAKLAEICQKNTQSRIWRSNRMQFSQFLSSIKSQSKLNRQNIRILLPTQTIRQMDTKNFIDLDLELQQFLIFDYRKIDEEWILKMAKKHNCPKCKKQNYLTAFLEKDKLSYCLDCDHTATEIKPKSFIPVEKPKKNSPFYYNSSEDSTYKNQAEYSKDQTSSSQKYNSRLRPKRRFVNSYLSENVRSESSESQKKQKSYLRLKKSNPNQPKQENTGPSQEFKHPIEPQNPSISNRQQNQIFEENSKVVPPSDLQADLQYKKIASRMKMNILPKLITTSPRPISQFTPKLNNFKIKLTNKQKKRNKNPKEQANTLELF